MGKKDSGETRDIDQAMLAQSAVKSLLELFVVILLKLSGSGPMPDRRWDWK
jgi:hypothetical protein